MRLNAYYYAFDPTGSEDIDRILSAVACARKAYHHTENWTEDIAMPYEPSHRGGSCVEWIQNAANDAAANLAAARREGVMEERARIWNAVTTDKAFAKMPVRMKKHLLDVISARSAKGV